MTPGADSGSPEGWWDSPEKACEQLLSEVEGLSEVSYAYRTTAEFQSVFELFIPRDSSAGTTAPITPGSAVIGVPADEDDPGSVIVFVEEPGEPDTGPRTLADRALLAVGWYYESVVQGRPAWATVARDDLLLVGMFKPDLTSHLSIHPPSELALAKWLDIGGDTVPTRELEESPEWEAEALLENPDWN